MAESSHEPPLAFAGTVTTVAALDTTGTAADVVAGTALTGTVEEEAALTALLTFDMKAVTVCTVVTVDLALPTLGAASGPAGAGVDGMSTTCAEPSMLAVAVIQDAVEVAGI